MIGTVQKYKVTILGQPYIFVSDEAESLIQAATALVDATMKELSTHTSRPEVEKIALLTAMTLALKHSKLEQSIALQEDQQAKLMSLLTDVDMSF